MSLLYPIEVPVNDSLSDESYKSIDDLSQDLDCLLL
jgi:hypothetical protein